MRSRARTDGMGRRLPMAMGLTLAASVIAMAIPAIASALPLSYSFEGATPAVGRQGWTVTQNGGSTFGSSGWLASGGNLGGHLTATDTTEETGCAASTNPCGFLYFESPTLGGGYGANYNGYGSVDLRSSDSPEYAAELVLGATSTGHYLDGVLPESSGIAFHHLTIPLNETAMAGPYPAWQYCDGTTGECSADPVTQAQFQAVLASMDFVSVAADVAPDASVGETYDLDNVSLTDGPPPAAVAPVEQLKAVKCKKKKGKKRALTAKKKKCKKHKKR
jgi:hypothetical protein